MTRLLIKSCLFLLLLAGILYYADTLFLRHEAQHVISFRTIYETDKKPVDILLLGNSHLNEGIHSEIIDAKCDANSIVVYGGGLNIVQVYYNTIEALKYHNPKLVVLETWPLFVPSTTSNEPFEEGHLRHNSFGDEYSKRFSFNKFEEIRQTHPQHSTYHMFNFLRYHEKWTDTEAWAESLEALFSYSVDERVVYDLKKMSTLTNKKTKEFESHTFSSDKIYLSEVEKEYTLKILDLLKLKDCKVLLTSVPYLDLYYNQTKQANDQVSDEIISLVKNMENVQFYDMNRELGGVDYTNIVNEPGIQANQHLNYKGAIMASNLLSNYINENYNLKGNSINQILTPEQYLYRSNSFKTSSGFVAGISQIDGKKVSDSLTVVQKKPGKYLRLRGWMHPIDVTNKNATKLMGLKKDNDFILVTQRVFEPVKNNKAVKDKAYIFKINMTMLESGDYTISNFLRLKDGTLLMKDNLAKFRLVAPE